MITAVTGVNWGDEGKGRMVDLLCQEYDVICRYQGGNNAGHTVVNDRGKFILNLLPSGILHKEAVNVMGGGMVVDIEHLCNEIEGLRKKGLDISGKNLKISDHAFICLPYHKKQDILEEDRLANKKFGSTRRGIAPCYADKYMKKGIRMADLLNFDDLGKKLPDILEWKNLIMKGYETDEIDFEETMYWLTKFGKQLVPFITDTTEFLRGAVDSGKKIMFEAQLGALRDIDYGIYPYTTSSQTLASYAPIGSGIPGTKVDHVIGVIKAYSSCVGEGPFTAELFGPEAHELREAGAEYGAATGRPRRVGGFDIPASRYGVSLQGADELALTKLDVLSYLDRIPVCVAYEVNSKRVDYFPGNNNLAKAKPIYDYLEGFKTDISGIRKAEDLPPKAVEYIKFVEESVRCPIKYVSVGPGRNDYLTLN